MKSFSEVQSWIRLFAFHVALIFFEKGMNPVIQTPGMD